MSDEELFSQDIDWEAFDDEGDDYLICDDASTTVFSSGTGVGPGQGTIPSYAERRKKRKAMLIRKPMPT